MPPALSTAQWIAIAVATAVALALALLLIKLGFKLFKALLILAYRKGW